jgi:hypothetical protein
MMTRNLTLSLFLVVAPAAFSANEVKPYVPGIDDAPLAASSKGNPAATVSSRARTVPLVLFWRAADGSGVSSSFTLINLTSRPATLYVDFYDEDGRELPVPVGIESSPRLGEWSHMWANLDPRSVLTIFTNPQEAPTSRGWARVRSVPEGAIGVQVVQTFREPSGRVNETIQPLGDRTETTPVLAFDNTEPRATAISLANDSEWTAATLVIARNEFGDEICRQNWSVPPRNMAFLSTADALPCTTGRRGTIEVSNPYALLVTSAFFFNTATGTITALQPLQKTAW